MPSLFGREYHGVRPDDLLQGAADELVLRRLGLPGVVLDLVAREDELPGEAHVAAAVADVLDLGVVAAGLLGGEVLDGDLERVGVDLAVLAVEVGVAVALLGGLGDHVEGGALGRQGAVVPGHGDELVVADVVVRLEDAAAPPVAGAHLLGRHGGGVVVLLEELGEGGLLVVVGRVVLDVGHDDAHGPARVAGAEAAELGAQVDMLGRVLAALVAEGAPHAVRGGTGGGGLAALLEVLQAAG